MTDLIKRLRNPIHAEDIMQCWDNWRKYIAEGGGGSWPRDAFEALLDDIDSVRDAAADALEAKDKRIAELEALCKELRAGHHYMMRTGKIVRTSVLEADLAAARACIRWLGSRDGANSAEFKQHLATIAAARGEQYRQEGEDR